MKKTDYVPNTVPTANIAVNKSRLKVYKNVGPMPTYYLKKGQEFQIELANPTTDVVLAKIILNGNPISQGGLVLRPGERVFLDRYIDVPHKFLFDTYEVSNSEEVKKAIEDNGDFKVEFYRERKIHKPILFNTTNLRSISNTTSSDIVFDSLSSNTTGSDMVIGTTSSNTNANYSNTLHVRCNSIETGRVEMGSESDQKFKTVSKKFDYFPFFTIEYKLLPISQKINTIKDINVKRYCTQCGGKTGRTDKFCSQCGNKI